MPKEVPADEDWDALDVLLSTLIWSGVTYALASNAPCLATSDCQTSDFVKISIVTSCAVLPSWEAARWVRSLLTGRESRFSFKNQLERVKGRL